MNLIEVLRDISKDISDLTDNRTKKRLDTLIEYLELHGYTSVLDTNDLTDTNDPVMAGALHSLNSAVNILRERAVSYSAIPVDEYMLKLHPSRPLDGYLQMLHIKMQRALSGYLNEQPESMLDSLLDLMNYTAFVCAKLQIETSKSTRSELPWTTPKGLNVEGELE